MSDSVNPTRRDLLRSSAAVASLAAVGNMGSLTKAEEQRPAPRHAEPLAQDYTVLTKTDDRTVCTCGPGITHASDGSLLATVPWQCRSIVAVRWKGR